MLMFFETSVLVSIVVRKFFVIESGLREENFRGETLFDFGRTCSVLFGARLTESFAGQKRLLPFLMSTRFFKCAW